MTALRPLGPAPDASGDDPSEISGGAAEESGRVPASREALGYAEVYARAVYLLAVDLSATNARRDPVLASLPRLLLDTVGKEVAAPYLRRARAASGREMPQLRLATPRATPPTKLMLDREARFALFPNGNRFELRRQRAVRAILVALAHTRAETPGRSMSSSELFEVGWPGEQIRRSAAGNRVRVAISTLRKMGLRDHLISRDDGWLLSPELEIEIVANAVRKEDLLV